MKSRPGSSLQRSPGRGWIVPLLICTAVVALYGDVAGMEFTTEDYQRINRHAADFQASPLGPLQTPGTFSPRFRPVQFYLLALEYQIFGTHIVLYRLLTLVLLTLNALLFFDLLDRLWRLGRFAALAATLLATAHYARVEVVYQQAGTFYLPGELIFLVLVRRLFPLRTETRPLILTASLFALGLLTVHTTAIFFPLALYTLTQQGAWLSRWKETGRAAVLLALPLAIVFLVERVRSGPLPILTSGSVQVAKNFIVLTSCLFYDFKPIGFTEMLRSGTGTQGLLPFLASQPSALAMLLISLFLTLLLVWTAFRGDFLDRFLVLGIALNTLAFMVYPGVSARFLTFSVLCLIALGARACTLRFASISPTYALLLLLIPAAYTVRLSVKERRPWVEEIRHLEQLKANLGRGGRLTAEDQKAAADLRVFWRIP